MSLAVRQMNNAQIVDYAENLERRVAALQGKLAEANARLHAIEGVGHMLAACLYPAGRSLDPPGEKATAAGERIFENAVVSRPRPKTAKVSP